MKYIYSLVSLGSFVSVTALAQQSFSVGGPADTTVACLDEVPDADASALVTSGGCAEAPYQVRCDTLAASGIIVFLDRLVVGADGSTELTFATELDPTVAGPSAGERPKWVRFFLPPNTAPVGLVDNGSYAYGGYDFTTEVDAGDSAAVSFKLEDGSEWPAEDLLFPITLPAGAVYGDAELLVRIKPETGGPQNNLLTLACAVDPPIVRWSHDAYTNAEAPCGGSRTLVTRHFRAIDGCGAQATHSQLITVAAECERGAGATCDDRAPVARRREPVASAMIVQPVPTEHLTVTFESIEDETPDGYYSVVKWQRDADGIIQPPQDGGIIQPPTDGGIVQPVEELARVGPGGDTTRVVAHPDLNRTDSFSVDWVTPDTTTAETTTSVRDGERAAPTLRAFPNPGRSHLRLSWDLPAGTAQAHVSIVDAQGRRVFADPVQPSATGVAVDAALLSPGLYFVRLSIAGDVVASTRWLRAE